MAGNSSSWMFFFGVLMLLIGFYGVIRMVHIETRHVPYPIKGVYPTNVLLPGNGSYLSTRESECETYPQVYYDYGLDGKQVAREQTPEESMVQDQLLKRCISGFDEDRAKQRQYDRNQAGFLVFVGAGFLIARRFLS